MTFPEIRSTFQLLRSVWYRHFVVLATWALWYAEFWMCPVVVRKRSIFPRREAVLRNFLIFTLRISFGVSVNCVCALLWRSSCASFYNWMKYNVSPSMRYTSCAGQKVTTQDLSSPVLLPNYISCCSVNKFDLKCQCSSTFQLILFDYYRR
jgi:hypothetical protein